MGTNTVPDYLKSIWQTRQFDRNPGRGETILTGVAAPSEKALEAEAESLERTQAGSSAKYDEVETKMTAHRDSYRDTYEQIGNNGALKESELYNKDGKLLGHRDSYKDFYDSASILRTETPELGVGDGDATVAPIEETGGWTVTVGENPYTLTFGGEETTELAISATAANVKTALNALGDTVFNVTGSTGGPYTVTIPAAG